jgi:hypothetical protein
MTTELNASAAGFQDDEDATVITQPIDADALIDGLTDAQLDKLTLRMRRRTNDRIKAAADAAQRKAEADKRANPTAEERVRQFATSRCGLESAGKDGVAFFEDGSYSVGVNREMSLGGAQENTQYGGERGPWDQVCVIHQHWEARRLQALQRRQEVVEDDTRISMQGAAYGGFAHTGSGGANAAERQRVEAIVRQCDAVLPTLLALADDVRRVTREHTDLDQRNRAVDELIAAVPVVSKWMSPADALWRRMW